MSMILKFKRNDDNRLFSYVSGVKSFSVHTKRDYSLKAIAIDKEIHHTHTFTDNEIDKEHECLTASKITGRMNDNSLFIVYFDQVMYVLNNEGKTIDYYS